MINAGNTKVRLSGTGDGGCRTITRVRWIGRYLKVRISLVQASAKRKWRTKHMANTGPVATVLHMRKERDSEQCPRCEEVETNLHILQCKGEGTEEIFQESMEEVNEWIDEMK